MAQPKPLFIPWLQARIDSGKFPGVQWTNPGKTEFSVPWKHALRQDSSSTDVLIFKAWAEVSGNGQAQGDPSVWKRNFRSTLRAKHFTMVTNNSNETANPLKVFRWPVDGSSASSPSTSTSATATPPLESQEEEELSYPVQERNPEDMYVCFIPNDESVLVQEDLFNGGTLNQDDLEACLLGLNIQHQGTTALPNVPPQPFQELSGPGFDFQPQSPLANGIEGRADSNPSVSGEQVQMVEAQFMETLSDTLVESQFKTHFRVSVFYRGVKVSENLVTNEAGFKLVYRPQMTIGEVDPQTGLALVTLPQPPDTFNPMQIRLTQQVLAGLGAGVDVVASGSVVYSSRRGDTKAFWSHSKFNHGAEPLEVAKTELQGVFLLQDFVKGMIDFTEGGDSPSCCLYICLGEKWPDHRGRAWEKKLVMVEVVFTSLETLKEMAEMQGASSLQSVSLQISLTEMMEIC